MIVRKTLPEEYRRVNELFAICFETPYQNCPIDPDNDPNTHWAAYDSDGEMMSTFTVSDYTVLFDGHDCLMGGIGGVATLPEYRRRGGIRACFNAALKDMYGAGYAFSYLFPFSTAYYRKFGYETCVQKLKWVVDLSQLNPPKTVGRYRLAEKHRPMTKEIQAVDQVLERRWNMMVQHREEYYRWTEKANPAVTQEFTYVCFDEQNVPHGYTTFRQVSEPDGRNLICRRFCFTDREGFAGLMGLFKSLASDHTYVKFETPVLPSLQYLLPEWSLGAVSWTLLASSGMVRVINAEQVLKSARYLGTGRCVLEIRDPQIPENSGTFAVTFADGEARSVERTETEADAVMEISTFSALIAGVCDWEDAKHTFPGLTVNRDAQLSQVFHRKKLMICDYF